MTNEFRMNPYNNVNFDENLDRDLADMFAEEDADEPIGPVFSFDDYEPTCEIVHSDEYDEENDADGNCNPSILERLFGEEAFRGFDFPEDEDEYEDYEDEEKMPWEEMVEKLIDYRLDAEHDMKAHFDELEEAALMELDSDSGDVSWFASQVLGQLSFIKRAGVMLSLLPAKKDCDRVLDILNGVTEH